MRILLDKTLKRWIGYQVDAMMARDAEMDRNEIVLSVLGEFVRSGDAERYVRHDGKIGWRATTRFIEKMREGEEEAEQHDELV